MSKINVYNSSASYAIKVFDTNSTGLKPDDAILVTTGSDPTNAIQINVGEKQDDYIAVTFAGGEPGPTPPEPSDTHTITISPSINGSVIATPSEGNPGTIVTLSNTPNDYCTFEKYNITGAELTGNTFEIGDSDIDVQGVFVADQYNVSYTNDGHGSLTGTLTTATGGMTTTLTAVPNTHYNLGDITVTGGTVNGKVLTVTSNCTANASYIPKQYTVTYQNNGYGTLTGGVTTATGNSTTTLTATPNNHYSLANYTVTGGTVNGNTLTITADCTAQANFTMIQPYTLTLQQTTGGSIGSTKNTGYSGDTATLSYTPAADYTFGSWSVTGGTINGNTFTFGNSNATAKAAFNTNGSYNNTAFKYDFNSNIKASKATNIVENESWTPTAIRDKTWSVNGADTVNVSSIYAYKYKVGTNSINGLNLGYNINELLGQYKSRNFVSLNNNYIRLYDANTNNKVTYSSNKLYKNGIYYYYIVDSSWYSDPKYISYVFSGGNDNMFISSFYNNELLLIASAYNMSYGTSATKSIFGGLYKYTGSAQTVDLPNEKQRQYRYSSANGNIDIHVRSFSNVNSAIYWATH